MINVTHIIISSLPCLLSTIGTSIGQGLIGKHAVQAIHKQPAVADNISKLCVIGVAITETAAVIGTVITLMLLGEMHHANDWSSYALIGIALAVGISGFCAGIASAYPAMASCHSLARQPFLHNKILNMMLITQTLIMTPNMFGMFVAILIKTQMAAVTDFAQAMQLFASGLSIGLGCIGPSIGLSLFAFAACTAIGVNKIASRKILTFTFIGEAIIETPMIFSFVISLMILTTSLIPTSIIQCWQFLAAGLCIGLSTISPGINLGRTGAAACKEISMYPDQYGNISNISMLAMALIDTFTIYGLLISIVILLF
jgi:F-type H+-transporting ATPase subunit c